MVIKAPVNVGEKIDQEMADHVGHQIASPKIKQGKDQSERQRNDYFVRTHSRTLLRHASKNEKKKNKHQSVQNLRDLVKNLLVSATKSV